LCRLAEEAGITAVAYDLRATVPDHRLARSPAEVAQRAKTVILAVPVGRFPQILGEVRPHLTAEHVIVDVGSVKVEPMSVLRDALGGEVPWVGSHPLFGPQSLARGERPLRVVLCPAPEHPRAATHVRAVYEAMGCRVRVMDADEHDRSMASTHALTFFLAKGLLDIEADFGAESLPPSTRGIAGAIRTVQADAGHLFEMLHRSNPFAAEARAGLLDALGELDRVLSLPEPATTTGAYAAVHIPDLGSASPELREVRDLIDELDMEVVTLLARRGRLARRARTAKSRIGRAVRDPKREDELLQDRRAWAAARGLDPDRVETIFRAIIHFSVALQEDQ
jgi:prephenate dehydrogenase